MPKNERASRRNVILRCTVCHKTGHNRVKHKNDTIPPSTSETITVDHMDHAAFDRMTAEDIQVTTMATENIPIQPSIYQGSDERRK
ncbi:hypothetical protein LINPERHAP1_LOCUS29398, partial [Linum perenne]